MFGRNEVERSRDDPYVSAMIHRLFKAGEQTSGRRIRSLFWCATGVALTLAVAALIAVREVARSLSDVAFDDATALIEVQKLRIAAETKGRKARGFLLTGDEETLTELARAAERYASRLRALDRSMPEASQKRSLEQIAAADRAYQRSLDRAIAMRKDGAPLETVKERFELEVQPAREELDHAITELSSLQERRLRDAARHARGRVSLAFWMLGGLAGAGVLCSAALAILLSRSLRALARQTNKLCELNTELDAFAGRVAHDLRNAMAPLSFIAALLRAGGGAPREPAALADKLQRTLDRSLAMLDGLLAFSKSGEPDPLAACSTALVVDDALEQLAPIIARVEGTVERDIEDATVACSRELLNVVVLNVLGNAIKFLEGRPLRLVQIGARSASGWCELTVTDSGPGISRETLGRIFEPFYRVPGTKVSGSGIGLATVHRIVHSHGGRIRVESEVGRGTTFRVELPLASPALTAPGSKLRGGTISGRS